MVFKRRKQLSWGQWLAEGVYPRSGWRRAASYVGHRLRRLPDTPHKIALGIGMGAFVSFTPFFGLHFFAAAGLAILLRANVLAALLGTFFGNPLTFPLIAASSMSVGHWVFGLSHHPPVKESILSLFGGAFSDLWHNFTVIFTGGAADWGRLAEFMTGVYLPYLVGGMFPGALSAFVLYFLSRPVIAAYQRRRKGRLLERWKERRAKTRDGANGAPGSP